MVYLYRFKINEKKSKISSFCYLVEEVSLKILFFSVADKVVVTSKHNNDTQHIWESDSESFSVVSDPRGDTLGRGTTVSLYLKEEAFEFLEHFTIKNLVRSAHILSPVYLKMLQKDQKSYGVINMKSVTNMISSLVTLI